MTFGRLILAGAAALVIAGPAFAQWPPPPPPFVANPQLAPPMMRPAAQPMTPAQARAARRAEQQRLAQQRQAKSKACNRAADEQKLAGRARRVFVSRCRAN